MPKSIDITGWIMKEHGVPDSKLTVIGYDHMDKKYNKYYKCKCECGNEIIARGEYIKNGHTKSCGCLKSEDITGWVMKEHGIPDSKLTVIEYTHVG